MNVIIPSPDGDWNIKHADPAFGGFAASRPRCAGSEQMAADFFYFCGQREAGRRPQVLARPSGSRLEAGWPQAYMGRSKKRLSPVSAAGGSPLHYNLW